LGSVLPIFLPLRVPSHLFLRLFVDGLQRLHSGGAVLQRPAGEAAAFRTLLAHLASGWSPLSARSRSFGFDIKRGSSVPSDLRTHSFSILNTSDRPLLAVFEARFGFGHRHRAVASPRTCIS